MNPRQLNDPASRGSLSMLILLAMVAAAVTALGCAWPGTSHSVRFNAYQTEREMGRLPPLPTRANGLNDRRAGWDEDEEFDFEDYSNSPDHSKKLDDLWERAEKSQNDGNLRLERELLIEYLKTSESFERRSSANDRLDALTALDQGSSSSAVKAYLEARRLHDGDKPDPTEINRLLETIQSDRNLQDNVAYLRAAEQYRQQNFDEAATSFKELAARYGRSEKREAALFMTAVATMKTSATFVPASGNSDYDQPGSPTSVDEAWHDAFASFRKVIDEYPRGRYSSDARGWQAYLQLRRRDRAAAMVEYYRLLTDPDAAARREAVISLQMIRSFATDDEMARVEQSLAGEPATALAYAYHNIYNFSIDPGPLYPNYGGEIYDSKGQIDYGAEQERNERMDREWAKKRVAIGRKELLRTLEFSKRLIATHPNLVMGVAFALRAAQASEELEDNSSAAQFAQRALRGQLNAEEREQALWTLGVAQHRLRQFAVAKRTLATLIKDYPKSSLTEGARRNLAMIDEDAGDIEGALEQYLALDYGIDVAYLIDVLMTPEQLASFIQKHPDLPKKNELTYALGLRYLRMNRWQEARQVFAQVKVQSSPDESIYSLGNNCYGKRPDCLDPKDRENGPDGVPIVTARLLLRDLQTANDLEALENAVANAKGDEATAEAMYQLASYQYEASTLLFYNPIAWKQRNVLNPRYWNLGELAASGKYRAVNESQILFDHMQEHDVPARALKIYLDIVSGFPKTRAARDALYTAAVCHERLASYNPYWREIYENGMHAGERMVTYANVKATYPNYQLPRGTYGWQPSTRTVNGGSGWAAPPPPQPQPKRLTRTERVKLYAGIFRDYVNSFWEEKGKRWLTEIVIALGLIFMIRIARRNQRRLRARLARQRIEQAKQIVTYPWFDWFWIDPVVPNRREQIRKLLGDKRQEFIDLARDRRSRPVLLKCIASHSLLGALSFKLLWIIWFG